MVGAWFATLAVAGLALLGFALHPAAPPAVRIALLSAAGVALLVLLEVERLTIIVTERELIVGFRLFKSRTPIGEVEEARRVQVKVWTHGLGIHLSFTGALAFTARPGPGVEVRRKTGLPVAFSCGDPDAVLRALAQARAGRRPGTGAG
jgi:hypothetical protein